MRTHNYRTLVLFRSLPPSNVITTKPQAESAVCLAVFMRTPSIDTATICCWEPRRLACSIVGAVGTLVGDTPVMKFALLARAFLVAMGVGSYWLH